MDTWLLAVSYVVWYLVLHVRVPSYQKGIIRYISVDFCKEEYMQDISTVVSEGWAYDNDRTCQD